MRQDYKAKWVKIWLDRHTLCKIKAIMEHLQIKTVPQTAKVIVDRVYIEMFGGDDLVETCNDQPSR